ncbi:hypothetical protein GA0074692_3825 [Micromonospora pallida]|uniref:V8-like Glu-specific endopeptidase n=1 Tax=Micromonospora pallida TaxID=145854 RepID=A0A1C6SYM2_9ACTN|nr:hypothetical protein [Micromonospora pallida]SCL34412.1 hypothetical protein GA0074692_3825 [Micromonospora pallida]
MLTRDRVIAAGVAVLCGLGVAAPPVRAEVASTETSATVDTADARFHDRPIADAETAQRLADEYWTPERMRAATPLDMPAGGEVMPGEEADRPGRIGPPRTGAEPAGPRAAAPSGGAQTQSVNASPGVGKVFFSSKVTGEDFQCSAAAVNNPTANLVATAGHCVHPGDGSNNWYINWVYVPLYNDGPTPKPYGTWAARTFTSVEGWTKWNYLWWDFAFVTMYPRNGQKLVHQTGGNGISFNQSKTIPILLLGYPGLPPYDGQIQHYCQGTMQVAGAQRVKLPCPMSKGASGGPFLRQYDNTLRYGFVNSVISYQFSGNLYGPYFEEDVADIYDSVKNVP